MNLQTIAFPLHMLALAISAWYVIRADHAGFDWLRGKKELLDARLVRKYHHGTWAGLLLLIVSGFMLFYPARDYLLTRPEFFIKMGFVAALFVNAIVIGFLQKRAVERPFNELSFGEKLPLFISGAISVIGWLGAVTMAFFLF